jgi:hypothetical protein
MPETYERKHVVLAFAMGIAVTGFVLSGLLLVAAGIRDVWCDGRLVCDSAEVRR